MFSIPCPCSFCDAVSCEDDTCAQLDCDAIEFNDEAAYAFKVHVSDGHAALTLNVRVELAAPTGNLPPVFDTDAEPLVFQIREDAEPDDAVCAVDDTSRCRFAADAQTFEGVTETIRYRLHAQPDERERLRVHNVSGALLAGAGLDYERAQSYQFLVEANDGGTRKPGIDHALQVTESVRVDVVDVNDAPRALRNVTTFEPRENLAPGTEVGCVLVWDDDVNRSATPLEPTQRLSFALTAAHAVFEMDADSGCLRL